MGSKTGENNLRHARTRVLDILQESGLSMSQAAEVLSQCHRHVQNRTAVEEMARESGLHLEEFRTNEDLELYYDIGKDGHDVGFISKGWGEPGFRIGELLILPADTLDTFRARAPQIMDLCSTSGVACTGTLITDGLEVGLSDNIYAEGFNRATFLRTLEAVHDCAVKVLGIMRGGD